MDEKQGHHLLYKQVQRQTIGIVWDNTTIQLPTPYHKEITSMQRSGVPAITTTAKIEIDRWFCRI